MCPPFLLGFAGARGRVRVPVSVKVHNRRHWCSVQSVKGLKWQAEQKQQLGNETAQNGCHVTASLSRVPSLQATAKGPESSGKWQHNQKQEDEVPSQSSLEQCDPFKSILHMHTYPSCTPASPSGLLEPATADKSAGYFGTDVAPRVFLSCIASSCSARSSPGWD